MHLSFVRLITLLSILLSCAVSAETQPQVPDSSIAIVANNKVDTLTNQQIYRLFSLRQKLLPSNVPVRLVIQPLSNPITQDFTQQVFDLYPYQLKRLWDRQVFSGKANLPKVIKDETELINFIIQTPHSLGYISNNPELLLKYQGELNVITLY